MTTLGRAVQEALGKVFEQAPETVLLTADAERGGPFGLTRDLANHFDDERVIDVPAGAAARAALALGLGLAGKRPIVEMPLGEEILEALPTLARAGRVGWESSGRRACPMVVRIPSGASHGAGPGLASHPAHHLATLPGWIVASVATSAQARAWIDWAGASPSPVALVESRDAYGMDVLPAEASISEPWRARRLREGADATLIAWGDALGTACSAVDAASERGISLALWDPSMLAPWDEETLLAAARETGRVVIAEAAPRNAGLSESLAALLVERAVEWLEAPVLRVTQPSCPLPATVAPESCLTVGAVMAAVEQVIQF